MFAAFATLNTVKWHVQFILYPVSRQTAAVKRLVPVLIAY